MSQQTHIPPPGKESSVNCQYIKKIANLFVKTFYFVFAAVFLVLTNAEDIGGEMQQGFPPICN